MSKIVKLRAQPATSEPIVKGINATKSSCLRPKMWEKEANSGWHAVEASKNPVPDQKP